MLARGMAKKRLETPGTAQQYTHGGPESGEALRLYLEVLKVMFDHVTGSRDTELSALMQPPEGRHQQALAFAYLASAVQSA